MRTDIWLQEGVLGQQREEMCFVSEPGLIGGGVGATVALLVTKEQLAMKRHFRENIKLCVYVLINNERKMLAMHY